MKRSASATTSATSVSGMVLPPRDGEGREEDQRIFLPGTWRDYETLLDIRGESSGVRISYLDGVIELMSPSIDHESIKTTIARLAEAYSDENGLFFNGFGSWTLKRKLAKKGVEPDECYCLSPGRKKKPDLAIEVVWTSGGLDKLEIYRDIGVREVWIWQDGTITVHELHAGKYRKLGSRSRLLPGLDLARVAALAVTEDQTRTVREFRAWLRSRANQAR